MPILDRAPRWAPWAIASLALVVAAAGWSREPLARDDLPAPLPTETLPAETPPPGAGAGPPPLAALARCASRLREARDTIRRIDEGGSERSEWILDDDAGVSEGTRECLSRPSVAARALFEARRTLEAGTQARREDRLRSVRAGLAGALGVTAEDLDWMGSYVCVIREMRADTLEQIRAGDVPSRDAFERLREVREAALADVTERLGEERYAIFRAAGGVGMLADVMDCDG